MYTILIDYYLKKFSWKSFDFLNVYVKTDTST